MSQHPENASEVKQPAITDGQAKAANSTEPVCPNIAELILSDFPQLQEVLDIIEAAGALIDPALSLKARLTEIPDPEAAENESKSLLATASQKVSQTVERVAKEIREEKSRIAAAAWDAWYETANTITRTTEAIEQGYTDFRGDVTQLDDTVKNQLAVNFPGFKKAIDCLYGDAAGSEAGGRTEEAKIQASTPSPTNPAAGASATQENAGTLYQEATPEEEAALMSFVAGSSTSTLTNDEERIIAQARLNQNLPSSSTTRELPGRLTQAQTTTLQMLQEMYQTNGSAQQYPHIFLDPRNPNEYAYNVWIGTFDDPTTGISVEKVDITGGGVSSVPCEPLEEVRKILKPKHGDIRWLPPKFVFVEENTEPAPAPVDKNSVTTNAENEQRIVEVDARLEVLNELIADQQQVYNQGDETSGQAKETARARLKAFKDEKTDLEAEKAALQSDDPFAELNRLFTETGLDQVENGRVIITGQ